MKISLFIVIAVVMFFKGQAQDSLLMKYSYTLKDYSCFSVNNTTRVEPLSKYTELFLLQEGSAQNLEQKTTSFIELNKTWRAKKNEELAALDFIIVEIVNPEIDSISFEIHRRMVREIRTLMDLYCKLYNNRPCCGGRITEEDEAHYKELEEYKEMVVYPIGSSFTFRYRIPTLHEVNWLFLAKDKETGLPFQADTMVHKRLFLTDSTVIVLNETQWNLLDVEYYFGYNMPDTVNNTDFLWKTSPIEIPLFRPNKRGRTTIKLDKKKKAKTIKLEGTKLTFTAVQKLYNSDEYLVSCLVKKKKTTYVKNLYLGKGSQLIFSNLILEVLAVNEKIVSFEYHTIKSK